MAYTDLNAFDVAFVILFLVACGVAWLIIRRNAPPKPPTNPAAPPPNPAGSTPGEPLGPQGPREVSK